MVWVQITATDYANTDNLYRITDAGAGPLTIFAITGQSLVVQPPFADAIRVALGYLPVAIAQPTPRPSTKGLGD